MTTYYIYATEAYKARGTDTMWTAYHNTGDLNNNDIRVCWVVLLPRGVRLGLSGFSAFQAMGSSGAGTFWFMSVPTRYIAELLAENMGSTYMVNWVRANCPGYGDICAFPVPFQSYQYTDLSAFADIPLEDCALFIQCDNVGDGIGVDNAVIMVSFKQNEEKKSWY